MKGKSPEIQKTQKQSLYPGAETAMQEVSQMAPGLAGQLGTPYGGQMVAGMDPLQQQAYQRFTQYMGQGGAGQYMQNPMYAQSKGLMSDVLGGKYLTADNPMLSYVKQRLYGEEVPDAQAALRRALAIKGNFYSSAGAQGEGDILENANDIMGNLYANQYQTELNRQMGMIPAGLQLAQQESQLPITDINQMMQMGEFPRQLEQQNLTAQQNEWLRQRQEQMMPLQMAPQMSQMYPQYDYSMTQGKPSAFEQWINPALQGAALVAAPFTGGASLMAIPALQGVGAATATPGVNPGGFAQFMNAFAPIASAGMGAMNLGGGAIQGGGNWWNPSSWGTNTGMQSGAGMAQPFPTWSPYPG